MIILDEILEKIFSFLDFESLKTIRTVSKNWQVEADRNFWKKTRIIVKGFNCWEIIHSKKLNIVSAIDIRSFIDYEDNDNNEYSNFQDEDISDLLSRLLRNIFFSPSLKEMRIYENNFFCQIPARILSSTISNLEKVTFFCDTLTNMQTKRIFDDIIRKPHKLKLLELNYQNVKDISSKMLIKTFKSIELVKILMSSLSFNQQLHFFSLNNKRSKVEIVLKDKRWWVLTGDPARIRDEIVRKESFLT